VKSFSKLPISLSPHSREGGGFDYDFIICGTGCAGLSLAIHLIHSGKFMDKKILLVDKDEKKVNDRTWCFWETKPGLFEEIVYRKWKKVWFHGENFSGLLDLEPYEYKMIRSIDFYDYCFNLVSMHKNFEILYGNVESMNSDGRDTFLVVDGKTFAASYIFNSIVFERPKLKKNEYWLLQHFKGWLIETDKKIFDPSQATLMDFKVDQSQGTTFVYTMPLTENRALLEYTIFSSSLLQSREYDEGLKNYLRNILKTTNYQVIEEETGIIPMTNFRFPLQMGNIVNIGTAGGQTKPSSGYTFRFIQKHAEAIVKQLTLTGKPFISGNKKRFHFYDSVLLNILHNNKLKGSDIFTALFKKNEPRHVLRFLDNESSLGEELKIISSIPTGPFLRAALQQLVG